MALCKTIKKDMLVIEGNSVKIVISVPEGKIEFSDGNGQKVLTGYSSYLMNIGQPVYPADYIKHTWHERRISTHIGEGTEVAIIHSDYPGFPDMIQKVTINEEGTAVYLGLSLSGTAEPDKYPLLIKELRVLEFKMTEKMKHWLYPTEGNVMMMRQGTRMPSDRRLFVSLENEKFPDNYDCGWYNQWMRMENEKELLYISESFTSLAHRTNGHNLFLGFVTQHEQATKIIAQKKKSEPEYLGIDCVCDIEENPLTAWQMLDSEMLMVDFASKQEDAVKNYAKEIKERHGHPEKKEIRGYWNSWGWYRKYITEDEVIKNMEAIRNLELEIEYIHIDDGYYNADDEWLGSNERFPRGMKWMGEQIRARGFKPSIWINPFLTLAGSRLSREHPEFLVSNKKGGLLETRMHNLGISEVCGASPIPAAHPIDYTVPSAREWLSNLMHTLVHEWGYTCIKLDGPARHYYDGRGLFAAPAVTSVGNIKIAYQIMRQVMGEKGFLLGEGYFGPSYGYADAHVVSQDWSSNWEMERNHMLSRMLTIYPWPSSYPTGADCLMFSYKRSPYWEKGIMMSEVSEGAAIIHWTNYAINQKTLVLNNSQLHGLDKDEEKRLYQFLPPYVNTTKRIDGSLTGSPAKVIGKRIVCPWSEWDLVGLSNHLDKEETIVFHIDSTSVPRDSRSYHVFDFWREEYFGRFEKEVKLRIPPVNAFLLSLRPARSHPEILSTNMHYTQGAVDLKDVCWNHQTKSLRFCSDFPYQFGVKIFIYLPENYMLDHVDSAGVKGRREKIKGEVLTLSYEEGARSEFNIFFKNT